MTPEQLCCDHPDLLAEVRERIAILDRMEELAGPHHDTESHREAKLPTLPPPIAPPPSPQPWGEGAGTPPQPSVAGYRILSELGHGGMGIVYKALDVRLQREVALKQLLPWGVAEEETRRRFQVEAEAVARLNHPHIAQVYASGEEHGRPWLAMELVPGGNLEQKLGDSPQAPRDSARLVRLLARAVQHAHERGIVHRDLKPGNVLLASPADEPALNCAWGCPKVADFGLARRLDGQGTTLPGAVLGTLAYMAPEQAQGTADRIGPATDVYALGGILYRLLTGRVPFLAESMYELLDRVVHRPPEPPSRQVPGVPAELEAICLKCLAKSPRDRYASAAALGTALEQYLDGASLPGPARPDGRQVLLGSLAAVAVLAGLLVLAIFWPRPDGSGKDSGPGGTRREQKQASKLPQVKMTVRIFDDSNPRRKPWLNIERAGAPPARTGELVRTEVELDRPAYCYLLLLSSQGELLPLYPWNQQGRLTVKDVNAPAGAQPVRQWSSPTLPDQGWRLDRASGLETLLLLVREEPLPAGLELRALVGKVPAGKDAPLRDQREAAILQLDAGDERASALLTEHRGFEEEAVTVDSPLVAVMQRVRQVFPVVRAARFAHVGE